MQRLSAAVLRTSLVLTVAAIAACRTVPERNARGDHLLGRQSYEIAAWFHFGRAACSLTFDDGTLDQYLVAYPELEARRLKATFFVITGPQSHAVWHDQGADRLLFGWDEAREMARAGHEIGSHSASHADLSLPAADLKGELGGSAAALASEIGGRGGLTLAWPFWRSLQEAARKWYIGSRSGTAFADVYAERGAPALTPRDLYQVNSLASLTSATDEDWAAVAEYVLWRRSWLVAGFHGLDNGSIDKRSLGWEALPLPRFRAALDWLSSRDFWIAPFGRVARYIRERDRAVLSRAGSRDSVLLLRLVDGLDNSVYDQALTLRLPLPAGWQNARIVQDNVEMLSWIEEGRLVFDAMPNGTLIRVERLP